MVRKYGKNQIVLIELPWKEIKIKKPLVPVSFLEPLKMNQRELAKDLNINLDYADVCDWYIIGGAQILGSPCSTNGKTLNVHPGCVEQIRGCDSFKRSVLFGYPIGCTLHIINEKIDAGVLLKTFIMGRDFKDGIHSLRIKLYNLEQEVLLKAVDIAESGKIEFKDIEMLNSNFWPARMSYDEECRLISKLKGFI